MSSPPSPSNFYAVSDRQVAALNGMIDQQGETGSDTTQPRVYPMPPGPGWFWAITQDGGPTGQADFTDNRHWFKSAYVNSTSTPVTLAAVSSTISGFTWDFLTNEGTDAHLIPTGTPVLVTWQYDKSNPGVIRYFTQAGPPPLTIDDDGSAVNADTQSINVIDLHPTQHNGSRKDFTLTADGTQVDLEWNGIDVSAYGNTTQTGMREISFQGDGSGSHIPVQYNLSSNNDTAILSQYVVVSFPEYYGATPWMSVSGTTISWTGTGDGTWITCAGGVISHSGPGGMDHSYSTGYVTVYLDLWGHVTAISGK